MGGSCNFINRLFFEIINIIEISPSTFYIKACTKTFFNSFRARVNSRFITTSRFFLLVCFLVALFNYSFFKIVFNIIVYLSRCVAKMLIGQKYYILKQKVVSI